MKNTGGRMTAGAAAVLGLDAPNMTLAPSRRPPIGSRPGEGSARASSSMGEPEGGYDAVTGVRVVYGSGARRFVALRRIWEPSAHLRSAASSRGVAGQVPSGGRRVPGSPAGLVPGAGTQLSTATRMGSDGADGSQTWAAACKMQERLEALWGACGMPRQEQLDFVVRHSVSDALPLVGREVRAWKAQQLARERRGGESRKVQGDRNSSRPSSVSPSGTRGTQLLSTTGLSGTGDHDGGQPVPDRVVPLIGGGIGGSMLSEEQTMEQAVVLWESCLGVVQLRERILEGLRVFEEAASDPARYFADNTAENLMEEEKQRHSFAERLNEVSKAVLARLRTLWRRSGDVFTFGGIPYVMKMQNDVVQMLHQLDMERLALFYENVIRVEAVHELQSAMESSCADAGGPVMIGGRMRSLQSRGMPVMSRHQEYSGTGAGPRVASRQGAGGGGARSQSQAAGGVGAARDSNRRSATAAGGNVMMIHGTSRAVASRVGVTGKRGIFVSRPGSAAAALGGLVTMRISTSRAYHHYGVC